MNPSLPEILFGLLILETFAGFPLADAAVRVVRRIRRSRAARRPGAAAS